MVHLCLVAEGVEAVLQSQEVEVAVEVEVDLRFWAVLALGGSSSRWDRLCRASSSLQPTGLQNFLVLVRQSQNLSSGLQTWRHCSWPSFQEVPPYLLGMWVLMERSFLEEVVVVEVVVDLLKVVGEGAVEANRKVVAVAVAVVVVVLHLVGQR